MYMSFHLNIYFVDNAGFFFFFCFLNLIGQFYLRDNFW